MECTVGVNTHLVVAVLCLICLTLDREDALQKQLAHWKQCFVYFAKKQAFLFHLVCNRWRNVLNCKGDNSCWFTSRFDRVCFPAQKAWKSDNEMFSCFLCRLPHRNNSILDTIWPDLTFNVEDWSKAHGRVRQNCGQPDGVWLQPPSALVWPLVMDDWICTPTTPGGMHLALSNLIPEMQKSYPSIATYLALMRGCPIRNQHSFASTLGEHTRSNAWPEKRWRESVSLCTCSPHWDFVCCNGWTVGLGKGRNGSGQMWLLANHSLLPYPTSRNCSVDNMRRKTTLYAAYIPYLLSGRKVGCIYNNYWNNGSCSANHDSKNRKIL